MRVGVELFAEGTLDRTHVNEIIKRAGVSRTLFYHYFPSKMAFARAIVEYEILHLHGLVEQQTALTLEGAISNVRGLREGQARQPSSASHRRSGPGP